MSQTATTPCNPSAQCFRPACKRNDEVSQNPSSSCVVAFNVAGKERRRWACFPASFSETTSSLISREKMHTARLSSSFLPSHCQLLPRVAPNPAAWPSHDQVFGENTLILGVGTDTRWCLGRREENGHGLSIHPHHTRSTARPHRLVCIADGCDSSDRVLTHRLLTFKQGQRQPHFSDDLFTLGLVIKSVEHCFILPIRGPLRLLHVADP